MLFRPVSLVTSCKLETGLYMTLVLFERDQGFTEITLLIPSQWEERQKKQLYCSWAPGYVSNCVFTSQSYSTEETRQPMQIHSLSGTVNKTNPMPIKKTEWLVVFPGCFSVSRCCSSGVVMKSTLLTISNNADCSSDIKYSVELIWN